MNLSRRSFLAGAGLVAAGSMASLSGCAPQASTSSDASKGTTLASTSSENRWSWSIAPEPPAENEVSEEVDCEVLVVGLGSGGVPATVYAAAMGADVVAVTAGDAPEGEGAYIGAYNTKYDEQYGIKYDPAELRAEYSYWGFGSNNGDVTGTIWDRSGNAVDWFAEYCNDVWPYECGPDSAINEGIHIRETATHMVYVFPDPEEEQEQERVYNGFPKFLKAACDKAEKDGARIYYSAPARQLIREEGGRVKGAYAQKEDGSYLKINASLGVLLATGDFHQNDEMLEAWLPLMRGDLITRNPYGNAQGDGQKMAWWIGAGQDTGPFNIGLCWPHDFTFAKNSPSRWGSLPWLRVNIAGERYTNETIGSHEWYSTSPMCMIDVKQPGHTAYQICDSKFGQMLENNESEIEIFKDCVERGVIWSADTIEELAEKVGFTNPDRLVETVKRYNEVCAGGSDVDFGVPAEYLAYSSVTEPPFYCMHREVLKQWTDGGVNTNRYGQVLDTEHEPIEGLYAAGNIRSGLAGTHYLWKSFGSNKLNATAGSMLCVKHMLGTWDEEF